MTNLCSAFGLISVNDFVAGVGAARPGAVWQIVGGLLCAAWHSNSFSSGNSTFVQEPPHCASWQSYSALSRWSLFFCWSSLRVFFLLLLLCIPTNFPATCVWNLCVIFHFFIRVWTGLPGTFPDWLSSTSSSNSSLTHTQIKWAGVSAELRSSLTMYTLTNLNQTSRSCGKRAIWTCMCISLCVHYQAKHLMGSKLLVRVVWVFSGHFS